MRTWFFAVFMIFVQLSYAVDPEVYFSPKDQLAEKLIHLIDEEKTSIHVAIYCFTHRDIAKALIAAKKRGVAVEVVVDPFSVKKYTPIKKLVDAGIPVYVWSPPEVKDQAGKIQRSPLMHNKYCVFGSQKVWTGSFNFTYEATRSNSENAFVLTDQKTLDAFESHFQSLKLTHCHPL